MANTTEHQFPNQSINNLNKSVLVVGGAGYIGSHISKHLIRNGYTPVIVDRNVKNNPIAKQFTDVYEMDLPKDIHLIDDLIKRYNIDSCICTAAYTSVPESVKEPMKYYQNNVVMTLQLLNKLKDLDVKKFIFSSSAAVYGIIKNGVCFDDSIGLEPINPYGQTKLAMEKILKEYNTAYGINSISFRYFNAAGADPEGEVGELREEETHIIPLAINAARQGSKFKMFGDQYATDDGTCVRDYVHVMDLADAHIKALNYATQNKTSEVFNLGSGAPASNKELLEAVQKHTGKMNISIEPNRPGDPAYLVADINKAKEILDWEPTQSDIDNVVATAVQWYNKTHKKEIQ